MTQKERANARRPKLKLLPIMTRLKLRKATEGYGHVTICKQQHPPSARVFKIQLYNNGIQLTVFF